MKNNLSSRHRRGAATIEFVMVAIPLFGVMLFSVDIGRALMVQHSLHEAARTACRAAILDGASTSSVESAAEEVLETANIGNYTITIQPDDWQNAKLWEPVTVSVSVSLDDATWTPMRLFLANPLLTGSTTLPNEVDNQEDE